MTLLTEEEIIRFKDNHRGDRILGEICNLACQTFHQKDALDAAAMKGGEAVKRAVLEGLMPIMTSPHGGSASALVGRKEVKGLSVADALKDYSAK